MALTQGSALPNITTTQTQATAAPSWYTDYLSGLANQGQQAAANAQYVGATPLQQQAFQQQNEMMQQEPQQPSAPEQPAAPQSPSAEE